MIPTYTLLTIALLSLWIIPRQLGATAQKYGWAIPFAAALVVALYAGILQPVALVGFAALLLGAIGFARAPAESWQHNVAGVAILVLGAAFLSHQLPGFNNPRVLSAVRLTPDAIPYSLRLNFDKAAFGLIFLGICHSRMATGMEWRAMSRAAGPPAAGLLVLMTVLALSSSYVQFAPKFPAEAWLWMWANLFLTCVGEEALFRGLVQRQLQRSWERKFRAGRWLAVITAAVLFGLAHFAGGPAYVVLSTIAGIGYGWAYVRSVGRIEASILTHFALNALHFFGFTYPALARA